MISNVCSLSLIFNAWFHSSVKYFENQENVAKKHQKLRKQAEAEVVPSSS